jgi:hypothetical protein
VLPPPKITNEEHLLSSSSIENRRRYVQALSGTSDFNKLSEKATIDVLECVSQPKSDEQGEEEEEDDDALC